MKNISGKEIMAWRQRIGIMGRRNGERKWRNGNGVMA
jgi:hypothetical protein